MVKLGAGLLVLSNPANINTATAAAGGWRVEGGGTLRISADGSLGAPLPDTARNSITDIQLNQFYHNIGFNTTNWTGWPSDDNNYVNEASWHLTWQLVLNKLQPTA